MGAAQPKDYTIEELKLCLATISVPKGSKPPEKEDVRLFLAFCDRTGLDYMSRQAYLINRSGRWRPETSVDGLRCIALRSGSYMGQDGPYWCGEDGKWVDVWTRKEPPFAAKVGVYRRDFNKPTYGVVRMDQFLPTRGLYADSPWVRMPDIMLAKVAESQALRKSFPFELSGVYSSEEMAQAEGGGTVVEQQQPITRQTFTNNYDASYDEEPRSPSALGVSDDVGHRDIPEPEEPHHRELSDPDEMAPDDNAPLTDEEKKVFINTYGPGCGGVDIPKALLGPFCKYVTGRFSFAEQTRQTYDVLMSEETYNLAISQMTPKQNTKLHSIIANHDKLSSECVKLFAEHGVKIESMTDMKYWMAAVAIEVFSKPNYAKGK